MTARKLKFAAASWMRIMTVLLALLVLPAHAADWNYRVRLNDNLWDLSRRYVKADVPWEKVQEYNQVADPYRLPPGMTLRIPIEWLRVQPAKAKVLAVIGDAQMAPSAQAGSVPLQAGALLGYGSRIVTGPDASLTLEFADGSRVLMQQHSTLELDRMSAYGQTGMVDTRLRLQKGRVSSTVAPTRGAAGGFSVETPGAISSVRGTRFRVAVDTDAKRSQTEVLTGRVDVAGGNHRASLRQGHGVAVTDGARPGAPRALLPPPALQCPAEPIAQLSFDFNWPALDRASHYRVQVAPGSRFEVLLVDRLVDTPRATLSDLPDGEYLMQVHGVDDDGLEGEDAVCSIRISGRPQPPLVLEPQAGSMVRDTRPRFRWTRSAEASSYVWQLAEDEQFTRLLGDYTLNGDQARASRALPYGRYYWRVASRDRSGKQGPFTDALAFDLVAEPPAPEVDEPRHTRKDLYLGWAAGLPGQRYHVQLDRDGAFADPLLDEVVDEPSLHVEKPGSGTWHVRVQVIDSDGYAGQWGPVQELKLPCMVCRFTAGGAALLLLLL